MRRWSRLGATGGRPGLAFDHDRHRLIDHPGAGERVEAENGGGRQAATSGQAIGAPDLLAVELGKCVDEVAEQRRLRMLPAVPGWVTGAIAQPEVRREVDDRGRERLQLVDFLAGLAMGQRNEEDVDRLQRGPRLELQLGPPAEMRVHGVHELSAQPLGCHLRHLDLGVGKEEAKQLSAGISGAADDRGLHRARWLRAEVSTSTPWAKSSRSIASSGVWSSFESPGP